MIKAGVNLVKKLDDVHNRKGFPGYRDMGVMNGDIPGK
jgi:hypothetical protein